MTYVPLANHLRSDVKFRDSGPERRTAHLQAIAQLKEHMVAISGDDSGSDPARYLPEKAVEELGHFKLLADHLDWEGAIEIKMRTNRAGIGRLAVWKSARHTAKAGLTKKLWFPENTDSHKGFIIGKLNTDHPKQLVAFCDDGLLRSLRSEELIRSYGDGWGRLPDADILNPAIPAGETHGVSLTHQRSMPFKQQLINMLPSQR